MRNIESILKKMSFDYLRNWIRIIKFKVNRIYHERIIFFFMPSEMRFRSIWRHNYWGDSESNSGPGSTLYQASNLIEHFPKFVEKFNIKTIFDAPCGDFNWMNVALTGIPKIEYMGGDLVPEIIEFLNTKHRIKNVNFRIFDITKEKFPKADVWLARAIFYHLSFSDICLALNNFIKSEIPYILTTNCVTEINHINTDIKSGGWRLLNLNLPPFNFPDDVLWEIEDSKDPHPKMKLTLWTRAEVEHLLPQIKSSL